jgi:PAS domain S-box-containing protein
VNSAFPNFSERDAAQLFAAIVESSEDAIISKNLDSIVTSWNPSAERIFGYRAEEMIGRSILVLIPNDRENEEREILSRIRRGERIAHYETIRRRKDGALIEISLTISPLKNAEGKIVGASKIARDVTEQKNAVRQLQENTDRLRLALTATNSGDWSWDAKTDAMTLSERGAEIFGVSAAHPPMRSEMRAMLLPEHQKHAQAAMAKAIETKTDYDMEYIVQRKDGTQRWVATRGKCLFDAKGKVAGMIGVLQDITKHKSVEEVLKRARDEALAASRAKDDFLAALSHELRTPLNPVLLIASEAAANPDLSPRVRSDFDMVRKNVELEARLIDDLLDLSRIARGKLTVEMNVLNAHETLLAALKTVESEWQQKKISFTQNFNAKKFMVKGDGTRLQQVFWNVLKNAIKFTSANGKVILTTSNSPTDEFVLTISDSGIGMTPLELDQAFEAFSQGEHVAENHRFGGLGLGLSITRMLIELHFGKITATSKGRNQGSTFTIRLPLTSAAQKNLIVPARTGDKNPAAADEKEPLIKILLVEDHEPTRLSLAQLLLRRRYKVFTAGSLEEARALSRHEKFDLLISDIGLPDGSGFELMKELRHQKNLKGIALTGYGMEHDIADSLAAGFTTHLTKPIRIQSLDAVLATISK